MVTPATSLKPSSTLDRADSLAPRLSRWHPQWLTWNWLGVLPFFIFIALFQLGPALNIDIGMFTDDRRHFVLENMVKLGGGVYRTSFSNTFSISFIRTAAGGFLCFMLAWVVYKGGL